MNTSSPECSFLWFIENYSNCVQKHGETLTSPGFTAESLDNTTWYLILYPRGVHEEGYMSLFFKRSESDNGPKHFSVEFELAVLLSDGSDLHSRQWKHTFDKGIGLGFHQFFKREEVLLQTKGECLPQDTLTVRCRIWKNEAKTGPVTQIFSRTRIGIMEISFLHVVEGFQGYKPNDKRLLLRNIVSSKNSLSSNLSFSDDPGSDGVIVMEITLPNNNYVLSQCKAYLLDRSGARIECGNVDNRFDQTGHGTNKLHLSFGRQVILSKESEYLPDGKLTLMCECTISTGVIYEETEKILHEIPLAALNETISSDQNKDLSKASAKLSDGSSVLTDLKELYCTQFLTDVKLKTQSKSFPAHKIILCARSPVFKAMMTNNMKEKISSSIQVDDLEDDTVQQLLLFLYTDHIDTLQWESAIKLYYAGDKYDIRKLKDMCSSFLVENLTPSTASELLLLADTHNDSDLKKDLEDFIFKHEKEVFGSDEWGSLIETNPVLVSKTMRLKYTRKM